jgi:hypothetical protein
MKHWAQLFRTSNFWAAFKPSTKLQQEHCLQRETSMWLLLHHLGQLCIYFALGWFFVRGIGGKNELENCRYSGLRRCFIFADKVHIHNTSHCQPDVVCTLSAVLQGPPTLDDIRLVCHSCFQVLTSLMLIYVKSKSHKMDSLV